MPLCWPTIVRLSQRLLLNNPTDFHHKRGCIRQRMQPFFVGISNSIYLTLQGHPILFMKQNEAVIETLKKLGGVATLGQLNQEVFKIDTCEWKTKTPFASIRRIVQLSPDIYKIKPGLYALKEMQTQLEENGIVVETPQNMESKAMQDFNHSYYQGVLLEIGNMKLMATFAPDQDKNKRYSNSTLGAIRTLNQLPPYTYPEKVKRSSTIDVIWFNERKMPHSFFEVEHSTSFQNSLGKYEDLQDFHVRMVIVSDKKRKAEFETILSQTSFKDLSREHRVDFLDYDKLILQYNQAIQRSSMDFIL